MSFERFTDRARKVLALANQEAQRFAHAYVGTEHVLLGLIKEGAGVAAHVLNNLAIDLRKVRIEVEKIVQPDLGTEQTVMGRLPYTPRTAQVCKLAIEEAASLSHNYVGTEHLLLGLLRVPEGVAGQVLLNLGLNLDAVRAEVVAILGTSKSGPLPPSTIDPKRPNHRVLNLSPGIPLPDGIKFDVKFPSDTAKDKDISDSGMTYNEAVAIRGRKPLPVPPLTDVIAAARALDFSSPAVRLSLITLRASSVASIAVLVATIDGIDAILAEPPPDEPHVATEKPQ